MSVLNKTKKFFGLGPEDIDTAMVDDYYDGYHTEGSVAYAQHPRYHDDHYGYDDQPPVAYETAVVEVSIYNFNDAVKIGEPFREGDAVIFDMSSMSTDEAKRIIDFVAGLCYALRGTMRKLDAKVFAIAPEHSTVEIHELSRMARVR